MGLTDGTNFEEGGIRSFSNDLLRIELSGPEYDHFSVIDLPGLFRSVSRVFSKAVKLTSGRADSRTNHERGHVVSSKSCVSAAQE